MLAPAPVPAPERFGVSINVCYGKRFPKDEECVSKVENVGKRDNSRKKVLVLLFAICGCVSLVGAVSAWLAFGLELFQLKSETASTLQQLNASINMLSQPTVPALIQASQPRPHLFLHL